MHFATSEQVLPHVMKCNRRSMLGSLSSVNCDAHIKKEYMCMHRGISKEQTKYAVKYCFYNPIIANEGREVGITQRLVHFRSNQQLLDNVASAHHCSRRCGPTPMLLKRLRMCELLPASDCSTAACHELKDVPPGVKQTAHTFQDRGGTRQPEPRFKKKKKREGPRKIVLTIYYNSCVYLKLVLFLTPKC